MSFQRLSIIGIGLLGGSVALAARKYITGCTITGYDRDPSAVAKAVELGVIDQSLPMRDAAAGAELTLLCTPVDQFEAVLREITPAVRPGAIISDVGSTKRTITRLAAEILPSFAHFVGSHPMAGSEKKGVENAQADLFQRAVCMIMPNEKTPQEVTEKLEQFWSRLGMMVTRLTPQEHDRAVGRISHLPQVIAMALTRVQDDRTLPYAGKGFKDTTRIAGSNPQLWVEILLDNRDEVLSGLGSIQDQLAEFKLLLLRRDRDAMVNWMEQASKTRRTLT